MKQRIVIKAWYKAASFSGNNIFLGLLDQHMESAYFFPGKLPLRLSEMPVNGSKRVDRLPQIQRLDDPSRSQVIAFPDDLAQIAVGNFSGAVSINRNRGRFCHADGIGKLHLTGGAGRLV